MAVESMSTTIQGAAAAAATTTMQLMEEDGGEAPLPGFRFHPTDEELVGYYLRRKVERKPLRIQLIKQEEIYKYDPWDLPKTSINKDDKEWYFFCKRGRKYKNSIRPNRVTKSGFWKATGIDRPIYSSGCDGCIGLKKSLVYYRGSAGKGTKTEWMMHEFRLPSPGHDNKEIEAKSIAEDAEVWTLCRILKRSTHRKCLPDSKEASSRRPHMMNPKITTLFDASSSETCSVESSDQNTGQSSYISFRAQVGNEYRHKNLYYSGQAGSNMSGNQQFWGHFSSSPAISHALPEFSSFLYGDSGDMSKHEDWEDLRSIVNCATTTTSTIDTATITTNPACL